MEKLGEIAALISRQTGPSGVVRPMPGIRLIAADEPTMPLCSVYQPAFGLVAQGAKRANLGDRAFSYAAGEFLVVSVDLPVSGRVSTASRAVPYLGVSMVLEPAAIAALLLETAVPADDGDALALGISTASPELLDTVLRLLRLLDRPDDRAVLAPLLQRELLWRLLTGPRGGIVRSIGLADSRLAQVGRAIKHIRGHFAEALPSEELAAIAGMSLSSFNRHFRAVTALSPLQYLKQVRLQEARSRLLARTEDVANVGFEVGYQSPSQFSREYSRQFGAPPGRDAARLRDLSGSFEP